MRMKIQREVIRAQEEVVTPLLEQFPWEDRGVYAVWLAQTYHYVVHTIPLLKAAADACGAQDSALLKAFEKNSLEEKGHDKLLSSDLEGLGSPREAARSLTSDFYQSLYSDIEQQGPAALLGRVYLLEGLADYGGKQCAARASKTHGPQASSFLRVHIDADGGAQGHLSAALGVAEELTEAQATVVIDILWKSTRQYEVLLRDWAGDQWPQ